MSETRYEKKRVQVLGHTMAYVEVGQRRLAEQPQPLALRVLGARS